MQSQIKYDFSVYWNMIWLFIPQPLDAALQQELDAALKAFVKSGQVIKITSRVDPSIIGGMIVSIGDKYVDMSTASKVKRYTDLIKAAV